MSGVDVLAVMDGCASVLRSNMRRRNTKARIPDPHPEAVVLQERAAYMLAQHAEARAAVAELIEADIEFDEANLAWDVAPGFAQSIGDTDGRDFDGPEYERLYKAIHRRAEAIERVIGGKA